jgi:glyoxylase-like metal-dependent hydrolase (beta-lactamase superfamily II)
MGEQPVTPIKWYLLETGYCVHPEITSRVGGSWRTCEFPALVALLHHPQLGWLLFDTGYGQAFHDATLRMPESLYRLVTPVKWQPHQSAIAQIAARGINPTDVRNVIVSHFHGDHVGGLKDFDEANIWCAEAGWRDMHERSRISALTAGLLPALVPKSTMSRTRFFEHAPVASLPEALSPFRLGYDLFKDESIFAVPLPGHCAGHFGICFRSAPSGKWIFLVADAAWSSRAIRENMPPPRWATAVLGDTATYRTTLSGLHLLATRQSGVAIVPSHCQSFRP